MENQYKKISVIGLGYIGLPTAAMFASRKVHVVGVDVNQVAVDTINRGEIHIVEPDLDMVVHAAVQEGYLRATTTPEPADAFLIAVPTPFKGEGREPDLSYIKAACEAIAPVLAKGNLVILESTSPVGATEVMAGWLAAARPDLTFPQHSGGASDIRIAHCPERVLPGKVMQELISNDRLIGGLTDHCSKRAVDLYKSFVLGECVATSARTAELSKLAENSFRDVNIAFANELSVICDRLGVDVWEVIALANRHPRVNILRPGPGVGGHCIAVDPWFIVSSAPQDARLIRQAREVNDGKPEWVQQKIDRAKTSLLAQNPALSEEDICLACYGLTFKPDIDDLRESPALCVVENLVERHPGELLVVEPNIDNLPRGLERVERVSLEHAHKRADIHIYLVGHRQFKGSPKPKGYCIDTVGLFEETRGPLVGKQ